VIASRKMLAYRGFTEVPAPSGPRKRELWSGRSSSYPSYERPQRLSRTTATVGSTSPVYSRGGRLMSRRCPIRERDQIVPAQARHCGETRVAPITLCGRAPHPYPNEGMVGRHPRRPGRHRRSGPPGHPIGHRACFSLPEKRAAAIPDGARLIVLKSSGVTYRSQANHRATFCLEGSLLSKSKSALRCACSLGNASWRMQQATAASCKGCGGGVARCAAARTRAGSWGRDGCKTEQDAASSL